MLGKLSGQGHLFREPLTAMLNMEKPLIALGNSINWAFFEQQFSKHYSKMGRPSKPIRLMVGLLIIKQLENLSDERLVALWEENPYWQYFCGEQYFQAKPPCEASELCHFRDRIGKEGMEVIFSESIRIQGDKVEVEEVIVDTTCQEKDVTYPTDSKLLSQAMRALRRVADQHGIQLRQSYVKVEAEILKNIRFLHRDAKQKARWIRKLRTIAGRLNRDVSRKLPAEIGEQTRVDLSNCEKIINQKREDKKKIYSLHEPQVACIAKGKAHKKFEFGAKAALAVCTKSGVIVGAVSFANNQHDAHTQPALLDHVFESTGKRPAIAIGDRIYKSVKPYKGTTTIAPTNGKSPKAQSKRERKLKQERFRKRAGIEATISHLKNDFRMRRNYLSGVVGDEMNLLLAAAAFNFKKWINTFWCLVFRAYLKFKTPIAPNLQPQIFLNPKIATF
jgi:IS5 family transposase